MTAGEPEGIRNMLTSSPWGTQEIGAGGLQGGAKAGGSDTGIAPSAAAMGRGRGKEKIMEAGGRIREA